MIISLLTRLSPQQCKMIMIDPKMLELSIYNDIPHLLTPVVTDMSQAVEALQWAVSEMETRYQKMAAASVRNIVNFNSANANEAMPYIVIVIDEVADLMMTAGKDVEFVVQRLAQMARAAGIHVIMATQRPSVDVITGTIKANFPTRISFQVSSKIDSRTILGEGGAEQLLGMGDMLYMKGGGNLTRVHGAFISDADVASFAERLKATQKPVYVDIFGPAPESDPTDPEPSLYEQAKHIVIADNMPKITYIQRKLGIGYFHASELLEQMEAEGVVSSGDTDRVVLWRPD
jgi:S-DNA-T family DNA segregation ATPase FtsK/SpoIIIE